jgi:hypothetical protein
VLCRCRAVRPQSKDSAKERSNNGLGAKQKGQLKRERLRGGGDLRLAARAVQKVTSSLSQERSRLPSFLDTDLGLKSTKAGPLKEAAFVGVMPVQGAVAGNFRPGVHFSAELSPA